MDKKKFFTGKMNLEHKKRIMKCSVWDQGHSITPGRETPRITA